AAANQATATAIEPATKPTTEPPPIRTLRDQIRQYEQTIREKSAQQEDLQRRIRNYQGRIEATPAIEQQYEMLSRDREAAGAYYNDLKKRGEEARLGKQLGDHQLNAQFRILDPASLPASPSFPNPLFFGLGGIAGGIALGAGIGLLLEMSDTSVKNDKDIE